LFRFNSVGRNLLGVLQHVLRLYGTTGLELPPTEEAVETLLAASKFGRISKRQHLISIAMELQKKLGQTHLYAEVIHQKSVLLCLKGEISESESVIQDGLGSQRLKGAAGSHFLLGLLHLSRATNQAFQFDFSTAHKESSKWQPFDDVLSERQFDVLWEQTYCNGRTLRGQGLFEGAERCFESCLKTYGLGKAKQYLIKANLADLYCELDYLKQKPGPQHTLTESMLREPGALDKAKALVQLEVEHLRVHHHNSKSFRRVLLSLIEVEIRLGQPKKAEKLTKEVLDTYSKLTEPGIVDRLGHVRALIAWARISPIEEAEGRWNSALRQNKVYNPFEEDVFTCAVIHLCISSVRFGLGDVTGGRAAFKAAKVILDKKRPQFLIPGVGTYVFDSAMLEVSRGLGTGVDMSSLSSSDCARRILESP
jgi:ATP/maltotriose-dependent transcriptional regulator MalT